MTFSRYYTVANLVVLSLVIYASVDIFYTLAGFKLIEVNTEIQAANRSQGPRSTEKKQSFNYYTPAINRNLFGEAQESNVKKDDLEILDLEPTALKVTLLGTVSGDDQTATAIIEDKSKRKQDLYKEGDSLQNATIVKILRGKVVLRVQDKNQILTMEEKSTSSKSKSRRTGPRAPSPAQRAPGSTTISLSRGDLVDSFQDVTKVLSQVRIRPHYKDGKTDGLLLSQVKPNSVFKKLGLRNGDIIQGIDGDSITSADEVMDFYDELRDGEPVSLDIMRRGRKQVLNYKFK